MRERDKKDNKIRIPIARCQYCKVDVPISCETLKYEKSDLSVDIWSCPRCDKVLNADKDIKIKKWIEEKDFEEWGSKPC